MQNWLAFMEHARAHHGAIAVVEGERFGIPPRVVRDKAIREGWWRPYPGVVVLPGTADGFWTRASAAVAAVAGGALLSRRSAAYAHGLLTEPGVGVDVLLDHRCRVPAARHLLRTHRSRVILAEHRVEVGNLACTSPARTLGDMAAVLDTKSLRYLVIDALRLRCVELPELAALVEQRPGMPGRRRLELVTAQVGSGHVDSGFEWEVRNGLLERGYVPYPEPFPWACPDGVVVEIDIAFPDSWVGLECDGRGKYADRRTFTTDRVRWSQLNDAWSLLWVSWDLWRTQRKRVLDEVGRRIERADARRAPAQPARPLRSRR